MNSLDTNILFYAANADCPEHGQCVKLVERALSESREWVVADQVWFELYRLLRNSRVLENPLSAAQAAGLISWYQQKSGWLRCAWEPDMMGELDRIWRQKSFSGRNGFDAVLAVTLRAHGVTSFYTRNVKDFAPFKFFTLHDPVSRQL